MPKACKLAASQLRHTRFLTAFQTDFLHGIFARRGRLPHQNVFSVLPLRAFKAISAPTSPVLKNISCNHEVKFAIVR